MVIGKRKRAEKKLKKMLGAPTRGGWPRLVSSAGGPDPPKVSTTSSAGGPDPPQAVMRWREGG